MAAHQPHRLPRRGAHRWSTQTFGQPADRALRRLAGLDHARRYAERPGGRVDQKRARLGLVVDEIALAELVLDELVGGAGIRHAQQRLRQHHQRQTFFGRQRELAQHVLDAAEWIVVGADGLDQPRRRTVDPRFLFRA